MASFVRIKVAGAGSFAKLAHFTPSLLRECEARGVSVVKPNGSGHTFFPTAPPPHLSGRRGFHTLARVLRALL